MNSLGARRRSSVRRPEGDAIVVLAVGGTEMAHWPLAGSTRPDLTVIDSLARLALAARVADLERRLQELRPGP